MLIKHYTHEKILCVIDNVKDIWVHPEPRPTLSDQHDFFSYTKEDLSQNHKVIVFKQDDISKVLRIFDDGSLAYICNDDGKTIEKVSYST